MATDLTGISHISLSCRDLEASATWYTEALGFSLVGDLDGAGYRRRLFAHPSGVVLGLQQHEANDETSFGPARTGLDHLAFSVEDRTDLDDWARRFDELGVTYTPPAETPWGQVLCFRDPDEIQLELFWFTR